MEERLSKIVWCVFAVRRDTAALSYLGELHRDRGTYTLKLTHAESTPWDAHRPYWLASRRRMLATFAEAGIIDIPPVTMTFYAKPASGTRDRNPLVLLGHKISEETLVLAHTKDVREVAKADWVIGHERTLP